MRIRFIRAGSALAAGVAVTAMLGMSAVSAFGASTKPDATTACGTRCTDVSFQNPGPTWILGAQSGLAVANNAVQLLPGGTVASDASEDFRYTNIGTVFPLYCDATGQAQAGSIFSDNLCHLLFQSGLLGAKTFSLVYNPNNGGGTNMCIGSWDNKLADGWKLRLEPCGVAADTVLILAPKLPGGNTSTGDWLINGASNSFTSPLVASSNGHAPVWSIVNINANKAADTQEVHFNAGPFAVMT